MPTLHPPPVSFCKQIQALSLSQTAVSILLYLHRVTSHWLQQKPHKQSGNIPFPFLEIALIVPRV
ncbi:hypothetical protein [Pajaroellobacter abortibovis]|uniref:hypothetical protein n=1 Tax=Pajaroellobacter abortibovis TaxID=1882918 RepID=UPI001C12C2F7|nr:hypothetical protein [Pajaroellobacter abortibovis]